MEFVEGFFGHRRLLLRRGHRHHHTTITHHFLRWLDFGNIARHKLDAGLLEITPRAVLHRDPTHDIDRVALFGRDQIVTRLPGEPAGDVADLGLDLRRGGRLDFPFEPGLQNSVVAERGKLRLTGQTKLDFPLRLHDGFGGPAGRVVSRAEDFRLDCAVGLLLLAHDKIERLPLKEREQISLRERIVAISLLENLQRLAGLVAQHHGVGLELQRGTIVVHIVHAGLKIQRNGIAHHGEILIVNREPRRSENGRRGQNKKSERFQHVRRIDTKKPRRKAGVRGY